MMMAGIPDVESGESMPDQDQDQDQTTSESTENNLQEQGSIVDRAKHDLLDILVVLQASNLPEVGIDQLVNELVALGYDIDKAFVVDYLQDKPFVDKIDKSTVYLKTPDRVDIPAEKEKEKGKNKVAKMASRALKKRK